MAFVKPYGNGKVRNFKQNLGGKKENQWQVPNGIHPNHQTNSRPEFAKTPARHHDTPDVVTPI